MTAPKFPDEAAIKAAVETAVEAFWQSIVKTFPEVESGDFPPELDFDMSSRNAAYVEAWLGYNHPASPEWADD